jgi:LacI family transcriptional regulator
LLQRFILSLPVLSQMAVTIRDVAKLAGTSVTAVSATLNGSTGGTIRVSQATKERIYASAAQLGYVSNPIAKSLATGKTKVLGLMLPYADAFVDQNPFCNQVMSGIMREVVHQHYNLMLYTATSGAYQDRAAMLVDSRIEGLLLVMPPDDSPVFAKCKKRGIPYVSILQSPRTDAWTVNSDDYTGGRIAAQHLIGLGHKRIAHLAGSPDVSTTEPRCRGFRDAMDEAGVEVLEELIVQSGFDWRIGLASTEALLQRGTRQMPTAIFAANDLCAEGAIRAIRAIGLSVPDDIAVVGYDDTWFATLTQPPLTTVHMPIDEMGELAARMLIARLEGDLSVDPQPTLPVSLTVRQSCGADSAQFVNGTERSHTAHP